jgi:hypothetical protein
MPMVTVSAPAGCANARVSEAIDIAIESAGAWRTIVILIRLDVLRLP